MGARELQGILGCARWENFRVALERARKACEASGRKVLDHFREVTKMVPPLAQVVSARENERRRAGHLGLTAHAYALRGLASRSFPCNALRWWGLIILGGSLCAHGPASPEARP
jgi:hypothetical protein